MKSTSKSWWNTGRGEKLNILQRRSLDLSVVKHRVRHTSTYGGETKEMTDDITIKKI